ncbi:hypothetical protein RN001_007660 [Aquatica leii]|uniref:Uncharacterized protein n=1 Tax=Aquatica leii TaxID=1421715 RepID=A0AAN7PWM6_9COLE|nr:hypothetical protein RN001_007660 [Aquatica leii]
MENLDGEHVVGDEDRGTRKRAKHETSRERKKKIRYSNLDPNMDSFNIRCNHKVNQKFECEKLTKPDILKMRSSFYKDPNKTVQDNFLATLMNVKNPQRKRSRKDNGKNHEFSVKYWTQISIAETNEGASRLKTELKVHKFRAKQFYKLLKELPPNTITFCCDLQQVQVLPKVPIQEAFYAQQLSCYFFCITTEDGITKSIFYSWMEHQAGRGAKLLRSYSVIKTPETYWSLYTKTGEVRKLGIDWHLRDIKNACACLQKLKGISGCKRIILKKTKSPNRVLVKTEVLYRNDDETKRFETLLKPRKRLDQVQIPELPIGHKIKTKLESLKKLLISLSGEDWNQDPELKWMEPLFTEEKIDEEDEASDADVDCECADTEHSHFL